MGETEIGEVSGLEAPDGPVPSAQGVAACVTEDEGYREVCAWFCILGVGKG